jgi:hypothetical protein
MRSRRCELPWSELNRQQDLVFEDRPTMQKLLHRHAAILKVARPHFLGLPSRGLNWINAIIMLLLVDMKGRAILFCSLARNGRDTKLFVPDVSAASRVLCFSA